jgi:hypothetical protein
MSSTYFDSLREPFGKVLSTQNFENYLGEIVAAISKGEMDKTKFDDILRTHGIGSTADIKSDLLDIILSYINLVLDDDYVTSNEGENVKFLKLFFRIREGDFYKMKYHEIEKLLDRQLEHMYEDNRINTEEALQKVELQELFDLSYDQFLHLSDKAVRAAIARGADPTNLDTFIKPK